MKDFALCTRNQENIVSEKQKSSLRSVRTYLIVWIKLSYSY
jgi:hypothetical protein